MKIDEVKKNDLISPGYTENLFLCAFFFRSKLKIRFSEGGAQLCLCCSTLNSYGQFLDPNRKEFHTILGPILIYTVFFSPLHYKLVSTGKQWNNILLAPTHIMQYSTVREENLGEKTVQSCGYENPLLLILVAIIEKGKYASTDYTFSDIITSRLVILLVFI